MLSGSIVALVTPMNLDESIDWDALDALVDWQIASGTNGIVAVGTTGESATLTVAEHCQVIERVVKRASGRVPVIAGTGANSTSEAIELTAAARDVGADACLLVTPYYNRPTQEGLYLHFKKIAEAVDIPQILYNVPSRTACDLLPETIARLAKVKNIVAIKEATGIVERGRQIMQLCGEDIILLSGDDGTFLELMALGAQGNISVSANVAAKQMSDICRAANQGDFDLANLLNKPLLKLHRNLFVEANPIPVKWALAEMGKISTAIRLPLTPLSAEYHLAVRQALVEAALV